MTPLEAISKLHDRKAEPIEVFLFLANHLHELKLADGCSIVDQTDCRKLFEELAQAQRCFETPKAAAAIPSQSRYPVARFGADHCHACGHVHRESHECGEPMGSGRTCRCEEAVTA